MMRVLLAVAAALTLAACANRPISNTEQILSNAGFEPHVPMTPLEQATLNGLTPNTITALTVNGQLGYYYYDPAVCGCVYVGNQAMFDEFQRRSVGNARADAAMTGGQ